MATVTLTDVRKEFGATKVLHGIDCEIADGEFVVVVGPSGCGKSTLLRIVAGLEQLTGGTVAIGGAVVNKLEPKDRDIAMVFQNYALYPHMTVRQNMAYGLKIRGASKPEIEAKVKRAAEILQLGPYLDRTPRQLSGGQRQRVAMGRAIVRDPKVFLFDEPLSNLDAKLRVQMRVEIKRLQNQLKVTSLYVTHDQVEAMTLADRLIVMNGGRAEQIGAPLELYARPATMFVAGFIGSPAMNFLPGRVAEDGRTAELAGGARLALPMAITAGRSVAVGIRPEHMVVDPSGPLALRVELVEALGADTLIYGSLPGQDGMITIRLEGSSSVAFGDTIKVAAPIDSLHLFDPESGIRISA